MTRYRIRILCVIAIAWLCAGSLPAEIIVPEGVEITETNLWTPFVDTLRIRETPDLNGQVIATIKLGEQVEYAGETSKNTSTVDFNGEKITDSWIKVKMKDGRIGWGWKGFMIELVSYKDKILKFKTVIPKLNNLKMFLDETSFIYQTNTSDDEFNVKVVRKRTEYFDRSDSANTLGSINIDYYTLAGKPLSLSFEYNSNTDSISKFYIRSETITHNNISLYIITSVNTKIINNINKYFMYNVIKNNKYNNIYNNIKNVNIKYILSSSYKKHNQYYIRNYYKGSKIENANNILLWEYLEKELNTYDDMEGFTWRYFDSTRSLQNEYLQDLKDSKLSYKSVKWYGVTIIAAINMENI